MDDGVEQTLLCWFLKAALLISDARVASRAPLAPNSGINQWFGLETQHNDCFQELEEDIANELADKQSFQLRARTLLLPSYFGLAAQRCALFYDRDTPLGKVSVNIPRSVRAILLEEWTFALDSTLDVEPGVNDNYARNFQHGIMLIRSLYSLLRVMPAWHLHRTLSVDKSMQLVVEASLSSELTDKDVLKLDHKLVPNDPDPSSFEFSSVVTPIGEVTTSVRYRPYASFRLVQLESFGGLHKREAAWTALTRGEDTRLNRSANSSNDEPVGSRLNLDEDSEYLPRVTPSWFEPNLRHIETYDSLDTPAPLHRVQAGSLENVHLERQRSRNSMVSVFRVIGSRIGRSSVSSRESRGSRSRGSSSTMSEAPESGSVTSEQTDIDVSLGKHTTRETTAEPGQSPRPGENKAEQDHASKDKNDSDWALARLWTRIKHRKHAEDMGAEGLPLGILFAEESSGFSPIPTLEPNVTRTISGTMSAAEIIAVFDSQHCPDISQELDLDNCDSLATPGGGFGDIYRGRLRNGDLVAIKCARLFLDNTDQSQEVLKNAARELYAWSKCQHICVAELLGVALFRNQLAMVSLWAGRGTLPQYIIDNPRTNRFRLCHQIATGLDYLHRISIVHGDIKGANVLISEGGYAQLTDFGSSVFKYSTVKFTGESFKPSFSLRWAAPELLDKTVKSSKEADIYALGMTILETMTGKVPYAGRSDCNVMVAVAVKKELPMQPEYMGFELWNLLLECWRREPPARPKATDVFSSTYIMAMRPSGETGA